MYHAPAGVGDGVQAKAALAAALDRTESVEQQIHALIPEPGRRERVFAELDALLARYPDPATRPPLFGIPFGVKDIFRVDGFETRAGSRLAPDLFSGEQATAVTRLREAGAIVIGKTVTTEFAYFAPGPTRNPWNTAHTPGGSSSGSAAAVSAGYCAFALGTQTIGSINRPAAFCGVVGFKPSYGRVPTAGVIPFSVSADHAGLLAADVASARAAASVMWDAWDPTAAASAASRTAGAPGASTAGAGPAAARTVLLLDDAFTAQADDEARAAVEQAAAAIGRAGFHVRRVGFFAEIESLNDVHRRMVAREFADVHDRWVAEYGNLYARQSLELINLGRTVSDAELEEARAGRLALRSRIAELLEREGAACILSPSSMTPAPQGIEATGSPLLNLPWTYAGVPTVTVPASLSRAGLPLGLQIAAKHGRDEALMGSAEAYEQVLGGRTFRRDRAASSSSPSASR